MYLTAKIWYSYLPTSDAIFNCQNQWYEPRQATGCSVLVCIYYLLVRYSKYTNESIHWCHKQDGVQVHRLQHLRWLIQNANWLYVSTFLQYGICHTNRHAICLQCRLPIGSYIAFLPSGTPSWRVSKQLKP